MGRGRSFSLVEEELLRENYDKTIAELEELLLAEGYARSRKSINRKLEKMRDEGQIGFRSRDTIKRSYRQRTRRSKKLEPTRLEDVWEGNEDAFDDDSLDTGSSLDTGASLDTGTGWDDTP
jgi:hypothetical protein